MAARTSSFTGTAFTAWPLSSGSWTDVTENDSITGTYSAAPTALIGGANTGIATCAPTWGYIYLRDHADPANFQPHNVEVRAAVSMTNTIGQAPGVFLKASTATTTADYYVARQVLQSEGKTGLANALAIERRSGGTYTRLVFDSDVAQGGNIAFRCIERASDVLLQAKVWTTTEPAWPNIWWVGTPPANPADGVVQVTDSTAGLWNAAGSVGTWNKWTNNAGPQWVANRGGIQNQTAQTSSANALTTANTIAVGNYLTCRVACDNSGTSGAAPTIGVTDPRGNTWTAMAAVLNDPGLVNEGVTLRVFYSKTTNAYTAGDSLTVTFSPSTTAKAIGIEEWSSVHATTPTANLNSATGTGTALSIATTASLGSTVLAVVGIEGGTTDTGSADSDTDLGVAWTNLPGHAIGTGDTGMRLGCGVKAECLAAGTATFDTTITSRDWAARSFVLLPSDKASSQFSWDDFAANEITVTQNRLMAGPINHVFAGANRMTTRTLTFG